MKALYRSVFVMSIIVCVYTSVGQGTAGVIKGKLQDSLNKQVLSLATITVFHAKDTSIITYRLSDGTGAFRIPSLPLNVKCRLIISYSGYRLYRKEFELTSDLPQLDLGVVLLVNDPKSLSEVLILAERPPVSVRKDTIEFNANAFKTLPAALVEDLLKKLPGVEVDPEGNISFKGKQVNRVLVDGKEFFGGDPKIATKNLPANIVDKVQVTDDKEDRLKNPDIAEADVGQIINIKLKRAIKEGWFGKAYAGGGTDKRYESGAIVNIFRDTTQVSLIAYGNNINKAGFGLSDLQKIGGFQRSGTQGIGIYGDGGISIGGVSFGGTGQGIQESMGGGFNFNHQFKKKVTLNLQYFYGQVNSNFQSLSNRQRFFKDTVQQVSSEGENQSLSMNHRIGGTVVWKIDSLTIVTFRPGITFNHGTSHRSSHTEITDNFRGPLNSEVMQQNGRSKGETYSHNLFITKAFKKKGRSLNINNTTSLNENANREYYDLTNTFYIDADTIPSNQLRERDVASFNYMVNVAFTEPISKSTSLRFGHTLEFSKEKNSFDPFERNTTTGKYLDLIDSIQSDLDRILWRNTTSIAANFRNKKLAVTPGLNILLMSYDNHYLKGGSVAKSYRYLYPSLNLQWKALSLNYSGYLRAPSPYELQPVLDNTNRQFLQYGNPYLKPSFTQSVSLSLYKSKPSGESYAVYFGGSLRDNSVIRETTVDKSGISISRPINVSGLKDGFVQLTYNKQYKFNKDVKLSLRPLLVVSYNQNLVSFNGTRSGANSMYYNANMSTLFNFKDIVELNQRYNLSISTTNYVNNKYYKNQQVLRHSAESEVVLRWPKHVIWENLVNYAFNPQVAPGIRKTSIRWNAGVNYLFLKEDKGQLKLSVFDLLNQNINVYRYVTENSILDSQGTSLRRYFMLSFIYNIRTFNTGKVGGKERGFMFF